jgi:hypothetical protein
VSNLIRELITVISEPSIPDGRERIDTIYGAKNAINLLFCAIAEHHGIDRARKMFMGQGSPPSRRKLQRIKNESLLSGYDRMEGKQSKRGYAKKIAKALGIDEDSAHSRIKRLIKEREKRDGSLHRKIRAELEALRNELKKR